MKQRFTTRVYNVYTTPVQQTTMKHFLGTFLFTYILSIAIAQQPGIYEHGIYDDFSTEEEYTTTNSGLFWWGNNGAIGNFEASLLRNAANNSLDINLTQAYGEYEPFGLSFGSSTGSTTSNSIDFSPDLSYDFSFTNNSDSTIQIRVSPIDLDGNIIDIDPALDESFPQEFFDYIISIELGPKSSGNLKLNTLLNNREPSSGTFDGGTQMTFSNDPICAPCLESDFNATITSGFLITVINANLNEVDGYQPYPLNQIDVEINSFKVGLNTITDTKPVVAKPNFSFPNPVQSDKLKLDQVFNYAALYDMTGQAVRSTTQSDELDLAGLENGLYILQTEKGSTKLILE